MASGASQMPCRFGVPSGMRDGANDFAFSSAHGWNFADTEGQPAIIGRSFDAWPAIGGDQAITAAATAAASPSTCSERETLIFEQPEVLLCMAVEDHAHLPRPREDFRILDGRLVIDVIRIAERIALDDVQRVTVEVPGTIEPGLVVEIGHVDDERVAIPASAGIAHPPIELPLDVWRIHEDVADGVRVLVEHRDLRRRLHDLKRER